MSTIPPEGDKAEPVGRREKVIHNYAKRSISGNSELFAMGEERAKELGYASFSAYIAGMMLFDCIMRRAHWLTVDAVSDPEILEGFMAELRERKPAEWPAYFEVAIADLVTPATEAQLRRIRFYGLEVPAWLKKGAAKKLISDYVEAHPESEEAYQRWKSDG